MVRQAGPHESAAVAGLLAEAFLDDPVLAWINPVRSRRPALLRRLFGAQLRYDYLPGGGVQVVSGAQGQLLGAAIWKPPGTAKPGALRSARATLALVGALRSRLPAALAVRDALAAHCPAEPHWYLNKIGTAVPARGQGAGAALLAAQLRHCDETATPAYLECTRQYTIGYYEKCGFTATEPIDIPHGGPRLWGMLRHPR